MTATKNQSPLKQIPEGRGPDSFFTLPSRVQKKYGATTEGALSTCTYSELQCTSSTVIKSWCRWSIYKKFRNAPPGSPLESEMTSYELSKPGFFAYPYPSIPSYLPSSTMTKGNTPFPGKLKPSLSLSKPPKSRSSADPSPTTPISPKTPADEGIEFFESASRPGEAPIQVYELHLDVDGGPHKDCSVASFLAKYFCCS